MKEVFLIFLFFPLMLIAQSKNQNYVKQKIYKVASTSTVTKNDTIVGVNYFDGLGRSIQSIAVKAGGQRQDIITPIVYDNGGIQTKNYFPYANKNQNNNSLNFRDNDILISDMDSYYIPKYYDSHPYSEIKLEASALGRVKEQAAPGYDWSISGGHTIKFDYNTNRGSGIYDFEVWDFKVEFQDDDTERPQLVVNGYYETGSLYKTIIKDENWQPVDEDDKTTQEFKYKQGRIILKRTFNNGEPHDTYYVYDDFSNLTFVIPPSASGNIVELGRTIPIIYNIKEEFLGLCYIYHYDYRNRLIEKKTPEKHWEYIVYDKLNRIVATGPVNTSFGGTQSGWMIAKYDVFNRIVYTGWYAVPQINTTTRKTLQNMNFVEEVRTASQNLIDNIPVNYTNNSFPTTFKLLTINHYDDYHFDDIRPEDMGLYDYEPIEKINGLPTGSWVRTLTSV